MKELTHRCDDLPVEILCLIEVLEVDAVELLGGGDGDLHEALAALREVELALLGQLELAPLQGWGWGRGWGRG